MSKLVPQPAAEDGSTETSRVDENPTLVTVSLEDLTDPLRCCWICLLYPYYKNEQLTWVYPCTCEGITKWVHESCLLRLIDEKSAVRCPNCMCMYHIRYPKGSHIAVALEVIDDFITYTLSPFVGSLLLIASIYWLALTIGAVSFVQIVGYELATSIIQNGDCLFVLVGLPLIPVGVILSRLFPWEDALLGLVRNCISAMWKLPVVKLFYKKNIYQEYKPLSIPSPPWPPRISRAFVEAVLLPTISYAMGRALFYSIDNVWQGSLLGGLTFIAAEGIVKLYMKFARYMERKNCTILDFSGVKDIKEESMQGTM